MNERIEKIVSSLHSAQSGQEVFDALCQVPMENLDDMRNMIEHILGTTECTCLAEKH